MNLPELSPHQVNMLQLSADGYSNNEISHRMHISISTVQSYWRDIFYRLGVSSRVHAVATALRAGKIT